MAILPTHSLFLAFCLSSFPISSHTSIHPPNTYLLNPSQLASHIIMSPTALDNFINNEHVKPVHGHYFDTFDPARGIPHAKIPDSTKEDVDLAFAAASKAFKTWSKTSRIERARIMNKIADLIESRLDEFARAESKDQGKSVELARTVDIPRAAHNFRFFAGRILHSVDEAADLAGVGFSYSQRMPIGVAGLISPWNL